MENWTGVRPKNRHLELEELELKEEHTSWNMILPPDGFNGEPDASDGW